MKFKTIVTISAIIIVLMPTVAFGLDVSAEVYYNVYVSEKLEAGPGVKLKISGETLYVWGSYEQTMTRFGGQEAIDINLMGAGIGMRRKLDGFHLWAEAGYYVPSTKYRIPWHEAARYEMNSVVTGATRYWDVYEYDLRARPGGALGISYLYNADPWVISLNSTYRYLRLEEWILGHNSDWQGPGTGPWWEICRDRGFSAWQIGLSLARRF